VNAGERRLAQAKILALYASILTALSCTPALTPNDNAELSDAAASIAACETVGRACQQTGGTPEECWAEYDACMRDAGLR
jgi:hypothetical protein